MLELQQEQKLEQKLSPQQIQYIKLLQLPTLELEQRIKDELEENPLLEEGEDPEDPIEERLEELRSEDDELDNEDEYDWEELLNSADDLYGYKARVDGGGGEDDREIPMPSEASITEELEDQLSMLNLDEDEHLITDQIIGSLDPDGYLRRELTSIVDDIMFNEGLALDEEDVERVLGQIQQLDPIGIASRDLQECLLVQLRALPDTVEHRDGAIRMLDNHYKAFTMKHFGKLGKRLDLEDAELKETFELVQSLNPKPGEGEFTAQENYITPDFTLRYVDGEFVISLNGRNAPELHISPHYRNMLEKLSAEKKKKSSDVDDETRDFLKDKFESARWFINSINQRRQTMLKVMHAIVDLQTDFFKYGEGNLKPMILEDIADIIEMDISTVSRVVNGKYVQTDFGVYELKYFFSEGLETESGEEVSNKEVKAIIKKIVANEDKTSPLSDQKVADRLEERGFKIARRTVTKYRKQLDIPVARLRKEIVLDEEE
jgi:RNA polymerase sigma-54 factor